jgi:hypothetical protein
MRRIQKSTLAILESARMAGRHETALKAIRETRGNIELIAKLEGVGSAGDTIDLCKLSAEELKSLLRASLGEFSARDRKTLLLEAPELADLVSDAVTPPTPFTFSSR